jgi:hypothetical protein
VKTVMVVSPFRASANRTREQHLAHAKKLCELAARAGVAPFASHVFYPLFLDEDSEKDREIGLVCEHEWLGQCDELWIWDDWGISSGMKRAIGKAQDYQNIEIRYFSRGEISAWLKLLI